MIEDPQGETDSPGTGGNPEHGANTADKIRNPRATRKGPDMPEDAGQHRTDPEEDYPKPDGTERGKPRGS